MPALAQAALEAKFQNGVALHQQGRIAEAARIYEEVLAADGRHFDALQCLGTIACQTGRPQAAVDLLSRAIAVNSSMAEPYCNLGYAFQGLGRLDAALASYDRAIALRPAYAQAYCNRGVALQGLMRLEEALASCNKAIELKPDFAGAFFNRGNVLQSLGRQEEALASFCRAIELKPDYAQAHSGSGDVLLGLGRFEEALASCNRAIDLRPDFAAAHLNRGNVLRALGRPDAALGSYDRAIALKPDHAQAHFNRGNVLYDLKRPGEALASYDRAVELKPDFAQAWSNRGSVLLDLKRLDEALASCGRAVASRPGAAQYHYDQGIVLQHLNRLEEALASYDRAIEREPDHARAHVNRGIVLHCLRRFDEALASYRTAIAARPELAEAHVNLSVTELIVGNLERGWMNFEWRRKLKSSVERKFPLPSLPSLADARGKTILVHSNDGFGDTLQFCRYAGLLRQAGARILFSPQDRLKQLMRSLGDSVQLADENGKSPPVDYHVPVMSLPLLFGTTLETIPSRVPYLFADETLVGKWRDRLGGAGFKIGICWQGNSAHQVIDRRCVSIACFEPLSRLAAVRLVSLHKGDGEGQLSSLPAGMTVESFADLDAGPYAFVDTAAVMKNMDLVITIDTSVAHLAGSLGVPTWVALQHAADWRWLLDRPDSPWYPSMRLFRQKTQDDWKSVFDDIQTALAGFMRETPQ